MMVLNRKFTRGARAFWLLLAFFVLAGPSLLHAQSPWNPGKYYKGGAQATYGGVTYSCLQAHTAIIGWEPPSTPALWQRVNPRGTTSTCTGAPSAPQNLSASSTTSSGTTLNWSVPIVPSGCSITGYTIFRNGVAIGSSTTNSFIVAGLSPSTTYSFTVAASDAAGMSQQSSVLQVTTLASSSSGGGSCAPAWDATAVYTAGMTASVNGINYSANWWTQGQNPAIYNGPSGSGQPWTIIGTCAPCTSVPGVPSGLTANGTTSSSTTLNWTGSTIPANCTLTAYSILRNGVEIGTSITPSYTVQGLTAQTTYSFAVKATDAAGSSAASASILVTTTAASTGGGGSKVFAPYIDMGMTLGQQLPTIQQQTGVNTFTLAFLLSNGSCNAAWGGTRTLTNDFMPNGVSIQTLINQVRAGGGDVILSFGGAHGVELALACSTVSQLQAAYQAVINRYGATKLDFDIEGGAVTDAASIRRRNQALVALRAANPGLQISFTLPVLPTGLVSSGVAILNAVKADGLALDVVNVMAMDYGSAVDNGGQMGLNATLAASNTRAQITAAGLSASVGVTPMIGVNDIITEIFQLSDAQMLVNFANANPYITRLSMWSVARDNGGCAGAGYASPTCSGIAQGTYEFMSIFAPFR